MTNGSRYVVDECIHLCMQCTYAKWFSKRWQKIKCCNVQHATTHCNTLQRTVTHCVALQHTATHCNTLQHTATHCNTLQHTCNILATQCNTQQHTATHCKWLTEQRRKTKRCNVWLDALQYTTTHCNTLQYTATHCNTLQHTATHCNTLQHTAAQHNTLCHTASHYKWLTERRWRMKCHNMLHTHLLVATRCAFTRTHSYRCT